jgi:F-type H+-transporting ATPase subunit b
MSMHFDWSTFALQTVNFAVLVWLLHRFLYDPVLRMIDSRRTEIERQFTEARTAEAEAKAQLAAIEAERASIAAERAAALKAAAAQAEAAAAAHRAQAEREAASLLDRARKTIASERTQALTELRRAALDLGAEMARKVLAEMPTKLCAEGWLERIAKHLATLPKAELDTLVQQLADGAPLKVVTASALPAEVMEAWRSELRRVHGGAILFEVDEYLLAGVELHFPNARLHFSWQSALAAMRAEIEAHVDSH